MGFFEKVRSTVNQGVSRVTSEADKTIKLTRLSNELGGKRLLVLAVEMAADVIGR